MDKSLMKQDAIKQSVLQVLAQEGLTYFESLTILISARITLEEKAKDLLNATDIQKVLSSPNSENSL